jgi:hypothetical protein
MEIVRAIRDDCGREVAWYCNGCGDAVQSLWGGLCKRCQQEERRHREMIEALRSK